MILTKMNEVRIKEEGWFSESEFQWQAGGRLFIAYDNIVEIQETKEYTFVTITCGPERSFRYHVQETMAEILKKDAELEHR
jgi:hypothetical protein